MSSILYPQFQPVLPRERDGLYDVLTSLRVDNEHRSSIFRLLFRSFYRLSRIELFQTQARLKVQEHDSPRLGDPILRVEAIWRHTREGRRRLDESTGDGRVERVPYGLIRPTRGRREAVRGRKRRKRELSERLWGTSDQPCIRVESN